MMELAGLWLGDGSWNQDSPRISCDDRDVDVIAFLNSLGHCTPYHKPEHGLDITLCSQPHTAWLTLAGLRGNNMKARTKRVPGWMFGCSNQDVAALLRGYFTADGGISGHVIEASSVSHSLATDVVALLRRFRILASVKKRPDVDRAPRWRITISKGADLSRFAKSIGFIEVRKSRALTAAVERLPKTRRINVDHSVYWDEVVSAKLIDSPDEYCYDISVPGTERFVSGGVLVHNSEGQIRAALKAITSVSSDKTLWCATCNKIANLPAALRRRFRQGTFFFDLPTAEEREKIWAHYIVKYDLPSVEVMNKPRDVDWTGAEVRNCCELADSLGITLVEAAKYITPIAKSDPQGIENLRNECDGRYLSASYEGFYEKNKKAEPVNKGRGRKIGLED